MTKRERLEHRLEKRREWADGRREDASARFDRAHALTERIPLGQPILIGHHSEKRHRATLDRAASNMDKGCENLAIARSHEKKAREIERQLEGSIFSDDDDAADALEARIAERLEKRERMKKVNAAHKKFLKDPASLDAADLTDEEKQAVRAYKPAYSWEPHPFPPYAFQNLGGAIRRDQERLKAVKARADRAADAEESADGVAVKASAGWCVVTFAEKPGRSVLDALKAAGYRWRQGSWHGPANKMPPGILPDSAGEVERV